MYKLLGFLQCLIRNDLISILKFNELHTKIMRLKPRSRI
jgi:hypothetical protein